MSGIPLIAPSPKPNQTAGPVLPTPVKTQFYKPNKPDNAPIQPMPTQFVRDADKSYEAPDGSNY